MQAVAGRVLCVGTPDDDLICIDVLETQTAEGVTRSAAPKDDISGKHVVEAHAGKGRCKKAGHGSAHVARNSSDEDIACIHVVEVHIVEAGLAWGKGHNQNPQTNSHSLSACHYGLAVGLPLLPREQPSNISFRSSGNLDSGAIMAHLTAMLLRIGFLAGRKKKVKLII